HSPTTCSSAPPRRSCSSRKAASASEAGLVSMSRITLRRITGRSRGALGARRPPSAGCRGGRRLAVRLGLMALLGAHVSTAGGAAKAFARGSDIGCESLQIFVKSPNQWRAKPLAQEDVDAFRAARAAAPQPVVAHAAYLINLAS